MRLRTTAASLTFPLVAAEGSEIKWKEYRNARFEFVLTYSPDLVGTREPDNGGGREFHSADGAFSVAAPAHFRMRDDGDSLERRWQDELKSLGARYEPWVAGDRREFRPFP